MRNRAFSVFIDADKDVINRPMVINALNKTNTVTLVHEMVHIFIHLSRSLGRQDEGTTDYSQWSNEGVADYIGTKVAVQARARYPDSFSRMNSLREDYLMDRYNRLKGSLANLYFIKGEGYVSMREVRERGGPDATPPANSVRGIDILLSELNDYKAGSLEATYAGHIFMFDLEMAVGEEAFQKGLSELARDKRDDGATSSEIYGLLRKHVSPDNFPAYDGLWETRVFGTERFEQIRLK